MGKSLTNFATQAKERARQQKQMAKAAKRMLFQQKKMKARANAPDVHSDIAAPISTTPITDNAQ